MNHRNLLRYTAFVILFFLCFSCRKDSTMYKDLFYGKWQTSYGDTITFFNQNGKNLLHYNRSTNPSAHKDTTIEFIFTNNKFGLKDGYGFNGNFRMLPTFTWAQEGKIYSAAAIEWFPFVSSTTVHYTFLRVP
jgi:hypothetical protein